MIALIILLSTIAVLLAIVIAIVFLAPFSIEIRTSKTTKYSLYFGDCMPDVWVCVDWFHYCKETCGWDSEDDDTWYLVNYFGFWESGSGKYINGKYEPEPYEDERRYDENYDQCPGCGLSHHNCACHLSILRD